LEAADAAAEADALAFLAFLAFLAGAEAAGAEAIAEPEAAGAAEWLAAKAEAANKPATRAAITFFMMSSFKYV
jgi:hypothetical protein